MSDSYNISSNTGGQQVSEKEFIAVVNKFSIEVGTARTYSGNLSDMLYRLNNFNLKADEKVSEPASDKKSDSSILDALKTLVSQLESVNQRNNEILAQLDKLV